MRLLVTGLVLVFCGLLGSAADNPLAGSWKLIPAKSSGPAPACFGDGILRIRPEIFTGTGVHKPAGDAVRKESRPAAQACTCLHPRRMAVP